ncbi:Spc98 family-domain-containing protein [Fennellomyces sp. T-0311]|nr:Spc98 family-domain-containing protein [Fennellomyces sp. T-0311]
MDGALKNAPSGAIEELYQVGFYIPFGNKLLEILHMEIAPFDYAAVGNSAFYRDISLGILCHTSIPYLSMLSEWVGLSSKSLITDPAFADWKDLVDESPVRDPYGEFFLHDVHRFKEALVDRFRPRKDDELPYFLNSMQAGVILRTGNALQLLRRFQPEHPLCRVGNASDFGLRLMPLEAQSNKYIRRLHAFADRVRQYNKQQQDIIISQDMSVPSVEMEEDDDVPTLKPLREIKLVSEFHRTLDAILTCHESDSDESYIPTLDTITDQSVRQPLAIWCPLVNESAMKLFTQKFHIQAHFELIRRFFLFGDDRFSSGIVDALFNSSQGVMGLRLHGSYRWPPHTSDLNMALRAVLLEGLAHMPSQIKGHICTGHEDQDIDDLITFGVREGDSQWRDPRKIDALNFLYVSYRVPYPLDIIITGRTLDKYNRMFTFLLQVHRINVATKHIYQKLQLSESPVLHRIRFQVRQFTNALMQYVFDTAIHATWLSFIDQIKGDTTLFQTMDPIMFGEYHEHVLDRMLYQCFLKQSQQPIKHMLDQVFEDMLAFAFSADQEPLQLFDQFCEHAYQFTEVLRKLHDRGIGRLGNVMNSLNDQGSSGLFGDFHDKLDAKSGQGAFAHELLTRLDMNGYYSNKVTNV